LKVLYVSHTGAVAGGEHSLLDVLSALPDRIEPVLATPAGPLAARAGVRTTELPAVDATLGGNLAGGLGSIVTAARVLKGLVRTEQPALVHANSIRAGLVACAAGLDAPVVVSVRDCLVDGVRSRLTRRLIHRRAALVIANSRYTARCFGGAAPTIVVYPGVDVRKFAAEQLPSVAEARRLLGIGGLAPVLGVVGQLAPSKGQDDAIRVLGGLRERRGDAVLLVVGDVQFTNATSDNEAYKQYLFDLVRQLGLNDAVHFLGERTDVPTIMRALDVLLVPSWEEPFGRTVVEALAVGIPVAATAVGGPAEILAGIDDRLLTPRRPEDWIDGIEELLAPEVEAIARRRAAAQRFSVQQHVEKLMTAYDSVLAETIHTSLGLPA
jgi:glycosyltransferase involved in cell wall biosynthesis